MRPVYCDESSWLPVATGLERRGWSVRTARDEGKLGDPDREQLAYAFDNDWILLTVADDFLTIIERDELPHAGVIFVAQRGRRIGDVVKTVDAHLEERAPDDRTIAYR